MTEQQRIDHEDAYVARDIVLHLTDGTTRTVAANVYADVLAIHPHDTGGEPVFDVTHVPTGKTLGMCADYAQADAYVTALLGTDLGWLRAIDGTASPTLSPDERDRITALTVQYTIQRDKERGS